jgi:hypothetical protein
LRVNQYRISYEKLQDRITAIDKSKSINELEELFVINDYGQEVPIMAFAEIYVKPEYYEPEIFVPKLESYNYQGRRAVKIELYCKKKNEKELIDFIKKIIQTYSHNFMHDYWKYEIVK